MIWFYCTIIIWVYFDKIIEMLELVVTYNQTMIIMWSFLSQKAERYVVACISLFWKQMTAFRSYWWKLDATLSRPLRPVEASAHAWSGICDCQSPTPPWAWLPQNATIYSTRSIHVSFVWLKATTKILECYQKNMNSCPSKYCQLDDTEPWELLPL